MMNTGTLIQTREMSVSVFAVTDVGMKRSGNEDAFLVADLTAGNCGLGPDIRAHQIGERGTLLAVSDGLGGAAAGEIASEMAVSALRDAMIELPEEDSISDRLADATRIANMHVWNHSRKHPEYEGMGATLTAVLAHEGIAYISQIGDSRAYLIRGDRVVQLTRDQSVVQELIDNGVIDEEQAASFPQNAILQALGTQPAVKVVLSAMELCRNDYLLLCSDGLSNKVASQEMRQAIEESTSIAAACHSLTDKANDRGGEDNITVLIARFDGESMRPAGDNIDTGSINITDLVR